jgi:hypothetical protein
MLHCPLRKARDPTAVPKDLVRAPINNAGWQENVASGAMGVDPRRKRSIVEPRRPIEETGEQTLVHRTPHEGEHLPARTSSTLPRKLQGGSRPGSRPSRSTAPALRTSTRLCLTPEMPPTKIAASRSIRRRRATRDTVRVAELLDRKHHRHPMLLLRSGGIRLSPSVFLMVLACVRMAMRQTDRKMDLTNYFKDGFCPLVRDAAMPILHFKHPSDRHRERLVVLISRR